MTPFGCERMATCLRRQDRVLRYNSHVLVRRNEPVVGRCVPDHSAVQFATIHLLSFFNGATVRTGWHAGCWSVGSSN